MIKIGKTMHIFSRFDLRSLSIFIILSLITVIVLATGQQILTGDEPRYLIYATAILKNGTYQLNLPDWQVVYFNITHQTPNDVPLGGNGIVPMNGVYLATLLAPIAWMFSLAGLRDATLIAGLFGLFQLFRLCRQATDAKSALIGVALAGLSIPLLPYLHLFYMETFIFALVCWGWARVQETNRSHGGDFLTAAVILVIPFVHLRGSVVAAALYIILMGSLYRQGIRNRAFVLALVGAAAMAMLIFLNLHIYGAITGPVSTARPPMPWQLFPVLAMQLFNVHHGLLAYAPVWILGYSGLWIAAVRGPNIGRQGLILAAIAAMTSIGVNPGECWPARFWVLSVPMMTVGFCIWWNAESKILPKLIGLMLIAFTLINTIIFIINPNSFLENRETTSTYQMLFNETRHFHFGLILPVEVDDAEDGDAARNFAVAAGLFGLLIAASALRTNRIYALGALLILLGGVELTRVRILPASSYRTTIMPNRLDIEFAKPVAGAYVQLGHYWATWFDPPNWFKVATTNSSGQQTQEVLSANQVIPISCSAKIKSISVESQGGFDLGAEADYRLVLYRSSSIIGWLLNELSISTLPPGC
jgi:hypothetical protein